MAKGPAINFENIELYPKTDTSLRILSAYMPNSDSIIMRIDAKIENRQYNVAMASTPNVEPKSGELIKVTDDLITPKAGILNCFNVRVSKKELIGKLKELLSDLENDGAMQ